jgi:site-specific recombinase XerD
MPGVASQTIRLTQRLARHKSILTTAIYSHPTDEDLLRAVTGLPC